MPACRILSVFAVWTFAAVATANAMTVAPMHVEMSSVGFRSRAQITVVNTSGRPLPVEAVIHSLSLNEVGKQTISQAGEDFLVMPPQALIPPGATQNFRVQWLGDPLMAQSRSYLLSINQIPVKLPKLGVGVQVVLGMGVMINVAPPGGSPSMQVVATGVATDKSGKRYPTITVLNKSNVHALLPSASIHLSSGDWSASLPPQMVSDAIGIGLVQPGKRRQFRLPVALPAGVSKVQASLD
jgi:fimbrial chaperone protein